VGSVAQLYSTQPNKKIKLLRKKDRQTEREREIDRERERERERDRQRDRERQTDRQKMLQQLVVSEFQSWKCTTHETGKYSIILLPQMIYVYLYQN
jgi:IS4 transposase